MSYKLNLCFLYNGHMIMSTSGYNNYYTKVKDRWHDMYDFTWVRYEK